MPYLKLLNGDADDGPIFGPLRFVEAHLHQGIRLGAPAEHVLPIVDGCVCYDDRSYNAWSVFDWPLTGDESERLVEFELARAGPPEPATPCDCEQPGYFHCGVPGVLAHVEDGRVMADFDVERCDQCRRYPNDATAREALRERGILQEPESSQTYTVNAFLTVRVRLGRIPAASHVGAARHARQMLSWLAGHLGAECIDDSTEFVVDAEGDTPARQRFDATLDAIPA